MIDSCFRKREYNTEKSHNLSPHLSQNFLFHLSISFSFVMSFSYLCLTHVCYSCHSLALLIYLPLFPFPPPLLYSSSYLLPLFKSFKTQLSLILTQYFLSSLLDSLIYSQSLTISVSEISISQHFSQNQLNLFHICQPFLSLFSSFLPILSIQVLLFVIHMLCLVVRVSVFLSVLLMSRFCQSLIFLKFSLKLPFKITLSNSYSNFLFSSFTKDIKSLRSIKVNVDIFNTESQSQSFCSTQVKSEQTDSSHCLHNYEEAGL